MLKLAEPGPFDGLRSLDGSEGEVGMQNHLLVVGGALLQVPLTYRAAPLDGADQALVGEMHHRVLGQRFVYDGLGDDRYLLMLAAITLTGHGQALGMAVQDGQWAAWPSEVRIEGGGWGTDRVVVDGLAAVGGQPTSPSFRNEHFELTFHRRPVSQDRPTIGITATWPGNSDSVLLAEARRAEMASNMRQA